MIKIETQLFKILIILFMPLVLSLGIVRLLATEPYVAFEYNKSDFPPDAFGFSSSQRLAYASANLDYVTEHPSTKSLVERTSGGAALYNSREISHMLDVHNVYQTAMNVWKIAFVLLLLSASILILSASGRMLLTSALRTGGLITAGLWVLIGISAVLAWQLWFVVFHQFFFVPGSWTFNYSDTLIRLFPEKFWLDSALTLSSLSAVAGFLLALVGLWKRKPTTTVQAG